VSGQARFAGEERFLDWQRTMLDMLAYVREQYGGVEAYLRSAGVTQAQLDQVAARLVE
jgi:hypothetical protein